MSTNPASFTSNLRTIAIRKAFAHHQIQLRQASMDLGKFITMVVQDDHGKPLELSEMHLAWMHHVKYCFDRQLKCMVLSHFGSGKSSTLAVPAIAYLLGNNPGLRTKIICNDDSSSLRRVQGVSRILTSSNYQNIFPSVRRGGKWTDHELFLEREGHALDPSVQARGVLTTGIGGRADLIVFDDAVDQRNSLEAHQRRKVTDLIDQTWLSRLEPDGQVLYVGTPWHLDDATHHLMQRQGWCCLKQEVSDDCTQINQTLYGAGDDYLDPQ